LSKYKVCLIVVYNHNYEKNYEIIESIYGKRFSYIYHLIPFTRRSEKNVFSVYSSSLFFGNYLAQTAQRFQPIKFDYFFIIADDVLLNPIINEENLEKMFKVNSSTAYFPRFINLEFENKYWQRSIDALNWKMKHKGLEIERLLPDYESWSKKLLNFNFSNKISIRSILRLGIEGYGPRALTCFDSYGILKNVFLFLNNLPLNGLYFFKWIFKGGRSPRPLAGGYSDIFIVPSNYFSDFCHLLGMLSSSFLHVELAIPTSLLLQKDLSFSNNENLGKYGETENPALFWDNKAGAYFFPENLLYLHPVKLSQVESVVPLRFRRD